MCYSLLSNGPFILVLYATQYIVYRLIPIIYNALF